MKARHLLASLLFVAPLSAQELTFRGLVEEDDELPGSYCLDCSDAVLTSSTVVLGDFVDMDVELTGTWNGNLVDPIIDVTAITPMAANFEITTTEIIGDPATFSVTGPVGAPAGTFYARGRGFVPFNGSIFLLQPATVTPVGFGSVGATGIFDATVNIPNNPALIGLVAYGQGFWFEAGQVNLTNARCFRVEGPKE